MAENSPQVTIQPREQKLATPEANMMERANGLFYKLGKITKPSTTTTCAGFTGLKDLSNQLHQTKNLEQELITYINKAKTDIARPIDVRNKRAELFHRIQKTQGKDGRNRILQEARDRDRILEQYLQQGTVSVEYADGPVSSQYNIVRPPENRIKHDTPPLPPIILIPGISNDLACVSRLAQELAFQGRTVITIGYPESSNMGHVTEGFAKEVEASKMFEAHTAYFKSIIDAMAKPKETDDRLPEFKDIFKDGQFELYGYSMGGPITCQLLNDPDFQQRVTQAVVINPGSSVSQSVNKILLQLTLEVGRVLKNNFNNLPSYVYTEQPKNVDTIQKTLKGKVFSSLLQRVGKVSEAWQTAQVRPGGKIVFATGTGDSATNSNSEFKPGSPKFLDKQSKNPTIGAIEYDGSHTTPLTMPEQILQQIFEEQAKS